jgi:hypothetical protein
MTTAMAMPKQKLRVFPVAQHRRLTPCKYHKYLMSNTFHEPDNDRSCRSPHAWHKTKLAFGWKPGMSRKGSSCLVNALLDLEDHARKSGGSVRVLLELAIRNYLKLTREQQRQAHLLLFAEYDRKRQAAQIERDFREAMDKCGMLEAGDAAGE